MKCIICGCCETNEFYYLYDDRYGYDGQFQLIECNDCMHMWLDCDFSPAQLTNLYSNFYPQHFSIPGKDRPRLSEKQRRENRLTSNPFLSWLYGKRSSASQWVPENVRLLDIGCSAGGRFKYHLSRGCDVYGIEANENARDIIKITGYKIHIGLFDPNLYEPGFFDYVIMDQVLEHMVNPLNTLQGISCLLKPQGKLIISTPNARGWGAKIFRQHWIHWHTPYHLHFFSRKSLEYLADQAGLKIIKHLTITDSKWLNMQWMHLITYPDKGKPSTYWGKHLIQRDELLENNNVLLTIISFFDKSRINDLITRFFDILHTGDNQIFILQKND